MHTKVTATALLAIFAAGGCSMPTVPSWGWSDRTTEASLTAESLYADGMRYFNDKRFTRAIDALSRIKTDYPFSPLLTDAELKIADAHYLNQQYPEAIAAFTEFQSLHPNNENIPFVIFRLGQAHFDQFTAVDREQKKTEIAQSYFQAVIDSYPKSPYALQAKEKLAKCIEYMSEHDFVVAKFYFEQEKYPAARDRFEEIVRKYERAPAAEKSLFYLGESYRREKNHVRAALAYEALQQHYPEGKFAHAAKTQLAQLDKERQDPLAMLLMRDRRAAPPIPAEVRQDLVKRKEIPNLVAKTEVVYEDPGEEKSVFRRVLDTVNPFGSADDGKQEVEKKKPKSALELLARRKAEEKESPGLFSRLWPFGSNGAQESKNVPDGMSARLVDQVDKNLRAKGVDGQVPTAAPSASAGDVAKVAGARKVSISDTGKLLSGIDANLKKSGTAFNQLPAPPEAAPVFRNPDAVHAALASANKTAAQPKSASESGLLGSIDEKLKTQGIKPGKFAPAPRIKPDAPGQAGPRAIALEPKLPAEKGPLFLAPAAIPVQDKAVLAQSSVAGRTPTALEPNADLPGRREFARRLVKGPILTAQVPTVTPDRGETRRPAATGEDNKGALDQLKQDVESIGKVLNPLRW